MDNPIAALKPNGLRPAIPGRSRCRRQGWSVCGPALFAWQFLVCTAFGLGLNDLTLLSVKEDKMGALADYPAVPSGYYPHGGYTNDGSMTSTPVDPPGRPPTHVPGPMATNGPANPWTNAIIVDLPHPGTVVNLSGAFLRPDLTNIVAISAGKYHALGIREDRSVVSWGNQMAHDLNLTNVPIHLTNTVAICAGDDYCLTLQVDGTIASWGSGVCATIPVGLYGIVALAAGPRHAVALKNDGTVVAWGPRASLPEGITEVKAIAASDFHTLLVRRDGSIQVFGPPIESLGGVPTNAVSVMAGRAFYALTADQTIASFGSAADAVPAGLTQVSVFSARNDRCLALRNDGTVVGWGNVSIPANLTNVTAVAAGDLYCLALIVHPPAPVLASARWGDHLRLSSPMAVSGYFLQSKTQLHEPWADYDVDLHRLEIEEAGHPYIVLPRSAGNTFFRLKNSAIPGNLIELP